MVTLAYAAGVIIFVLGLFVSIALHELGHLMPAKLFGCRVSEYMIGFGPKLFSIRRGETDYGVKLVPFGGYVKIIGMFPPGTEEEQRIARGLRRFSSRTKATLDEAAEKSLVDASEDHPIMLRSGRKHPFTKLITRTRALEFELVRPDDTERLFYKLPARKKIAVMAAGPAMNVLIAFVCFLSIFSIYGTRESQPTGAPVVESVATCVKLTASGDYTAVDDSQCTADDQASPARMAGLQPEDRIVSFNGTAIDSWGQLTSLIRDNGNDSMNLTVVRSGETVALGSSRTVEMNRDVSETGDPVYAEVGYLGAGPQMETIVTRHGPIFTVRAMGTMVVDGVKGLVQLPVKVWNVALSVLGVEHRDPNGPMSVVGGSRLAGEVASSDLPGLTLGDKAAMLVSVLGSFNLFIALFNLIPLLPLDGGHIAGATFEGLRRTIARRRSRPDPGYVNTALQLPIAYVIAIVMVSMGVVLMLGDVFVPLQSGL